MSCPRCAVLDKSVKTLQSKMAPQTAAHLSGSITPEALKSAAKTERIDPSLPPLLDYPADITQDSILRFWAAMSSVRVSPELAQDPKIDALFDELHQNGGRKGAETERDFLLCWWYTVGVALIQSDPKINPGFGVAQLLNDSTSLPALLNLLLDTPDQRGTCHMPLPPEWYTVKNNFQLLIGYLQYYKIQLEYGLRSRFVTPLLILNVCEDYLWDEIASHVIWFALMLHYYINKRSIITPIAEALAKSIAAITLYSEMHRAQENRNFTLGAQRKAGVF